MPPRGTLYPWTSEAVVPNGAHGLKQAGGDQPSLRLAVEPRRNGLDVRRSLRAKVEGDNRTFVCTCMYNAKAAHRK